jgi:hypothetical protein
MLAGKSITHARVHLPAFGVWWAEVSLDEEAQLSGSAALIMADLVLIGTIMSGGPGPKGRSRYRIAGGAGAWGKSVDPKSYANDAGVKASTVLTDAATACGERLDGATLPETRLGPAFVRELGPAARVLEQVVPANWYVGEDGITRVGARPVHDLSVTVDIAKTDRARGTIELATETIATVLPGIRIDGLVAVDVMHEISPGAVRTVIWAAGISPASRELIALRRLLQQLDPYARYRGIFEYRVVVQTKTGGREWLDLQPIRVSIGMPDLQRISVRPGIAGARADVEVGTRVLVSFVDANPARPVVVGFEEADGDGWRPARLEFDANDAVVLGAVLGALPAARMTDQVVVGGFAGTITAGSSKVRIN